MVTAVVREWSDDEGCGVLDSDSTPGGCWTHFSHVEMDGYRKLEPGQLVDLEYEEPGQDGYPYRAIRVSRIPGSDRTCDGVNRAAGGWFAYAPFPGQTGGFRVEVDGEVFLVTKDEHGGTHLTWTTGLNQGYGFSTSLAFDSTDDPNLATAIRDFLSRIDPGTG